MLLDFIDRGHDKLGSRAGMQSKKYYTGVLNSLSKNYEANRKTPFKDGSMGKKKAEFLIKFLTDVYYAKPNQLKILSDFEKTVDDAVRKGNLTFSIKG